MEVQQRFKLDPMDEIVVGFPGEGASPVSMHGPARTCRENPVGIAPLTPDAEAAGEAIRGVGVDLGTDTLGVCPG